MDEGLIERIDAAISRCQQIEMFVAPTLSAAADYIERAGRPPEVDELLRAALEMLRYYRSRAHRATEDDEGTPSRYHTVYGVHADAMAVADSILTTARETDLLVPADQIEEFHG